MIGDESLTKIGIVSWSGTVGEWGVSTTEHAGLGTKHGEKIGNGWFLMVKQGG